MILEHLKTAPDSQLSRAWIETCSAFNGTDNDLMDLFEAIHNDSPAEVSPFVKSPVNPQFTRDAHKPVKHIPRP